MAAERHMLPGSESGWLPPTFNDRTLVRKSWLFTGCAERTH